MKKNRKILAASALLAAALAFAGGYAAQAEERQTLLGAAVLENVPSTEKETSAQKKTSAGKKTSAQKETSAEKETSAGKKASAQKETSAEKETSTGKKASAQKETSAGKETSAEKETSTEKEVSAKQETEEETEPTTIVVDGVVVAVKDGEADYTDADTEAAGQITPPGTGSQATGQIAPPGTGSSATGQIAPPGTGSSATGQITPPGESTGSFFSSMSSQEMGTDEKLETLMAQLQASLPGSNGSWAVYVCDLVNQTESGINYQDHPMQAASLIKLYIMGAVFEDYQRIIDTYGQDTVDANLYSMITVSDNDAANTLTTYLGAGDSSVGMAMVNDFCARHGYNNTTMGRLLLHSNEYGDNYTSVADCGHFLKHVYDLDTDEFPYADAMYSLLKAQTRRNKIPAQMPEGVRVANKTGELDDVENDAGIVYDSQNDLIIVFMSEYLSDVGSAQNTIASLSRQIVDYYGSAGNY